MITAGLCLLMFNPSSMLQGLKTANEHLCVCVFLIVCGWKGKAYCVGGWTGREYKQMNLSEHISAVLSDRKIKYACN